MTCSKCGGSRLGEHMAWVNGRFAAASLCADCGDVQFAGAPVAAPEPEPAPDVVEDATDEPAAPRARRTRTTEEPANG